MKTASLRENTLTRLRSALAWGGAGACSLLLISAFMCRQWYSEQLAKLPFMQVNPRYTGGEVIRTYTGTSPVVIRMHRPVFEALIGEPSRGFIQIDFEDPLPARIDERIDMYGNGQDDFHIVIDTVAGKDTFQVLKTTLNPEILISTKIKHRWMLRVAIDNPKMTPGN